jgi:hypothetical protein
MSAAVSCTRRASRALNALAPSPDGSLHGFTIRAEEIGAAAVPPMRFDGPLDEEAAALVHEAFWS